MIVLATIHVKFVILTEHFNSHFLFILPYNNLHKDLILQAKFFSLNIQHGIYDKYL